MSESDYLEHSLADYGNIVPDEYAYYQKLVTPKEPQHLRNAYLKWYEIAPPDMAITEEQLAESRDFVASEARRLKLAQELGFVLLHRAGTSLLLMLTTWRNTNELFESSYAKNIGASSGYERIKFPDGHRATFCVWEFGPVWHERKSWTRFLSSKRDEKAKLDYINDRFSGLV